MTSEEHSTPTPAERAQSEDVSVRRAMAKDLSTPPEVLAKLTDDLDIWVAYEAASNPSTPVETLTLLAQDNDREFRLSVASNPSAPPEVLTLLAEDAWAFRKAVAKNPSTPPKLLAKLAEDAEAGVREKALPRIQALRAAARAANPEWADVSDEWLDEML